MTVYYGNLLTISGPSLTEVLSSIKGVTTNDEENLAGQEVYFDPQRLEHFDEQGRFQVRFDNQHLQTEEDGSVTVYFDSDPPAFYPIYTLSKMFPCNTFKLRWWLDPAPSIVLFRNGEASHVHTIPNHNSNTGKTATLFEIFCSHVNTMHDEENLDHCIERALTVVQDVKTARLDERNQSESEQHCTEHLPGTNIVYSSELDREIASQLQPLLYDCEMIPADEERIARLVDDLRSIESAEQTVTSLKKQTGQDLDFLVPERGSLMRFAILPCAYARLDFLPAEPVIVPVIQYTNADPLTQRYVKDQAGNMPPIEWKIRYLYLTPRDLWELRWNLGEPKLDDADFILSWNPSGMTMKHGGPKVPTYRFRTATPRARWKKDPLVALEILNRLNSERA